MEGEVVLELVEDEFELAIEHTDLELLVDEGVIEIIEDIQQGPPGVSGGSFTYTQVNPALVWTIPHLLGYEPGGIEVEDELGNRRNPAIQHVNANVVLLTFAAPVQGKARLS